MRVPGAQLATLSDCDEHGADSHTQAVGVRPFVIALAGDQRDPWAVLMLHDGIHIIRFEDLHCADRVDVLLARILDDDLVATPALPSQLQLSLSDACGRPRTNEKGAAF
jgi:hypothetical protein